MDSEMNEQHQHEENSHFGNKRAAADEENSFSGGTQENVETSSVDRPKTIRFGQGKKTSGEKRATAGKSTCSLTGN